MWESPAGSKVSCVGPSRIEVDARKRGCRSREWQCCPFPGHYTSPDSLTVYDFICATCCLPANRQNEDSTPALGGSILQPAVEVCLKLP